VEAVDKVDMKAPFSQEAGDVKETKGLGPEVVGCEVVNPGVDQNECLGHGKAFRELLRCLTQGIIQKCLHRPMKRSPTLGLIKERAGAFSAVTGGRAPSFHHLSMGEAAAPP